jgi:hypothetical protein
VVPWYYKTARSQGEAWGAQPMDQSEPIAIIIGCHFQMLKFDEMTFFFE